VLVLVREGASTNILTFFLFCVHEADIKLRVLTLGTLARKSERNIVYLHSSELDSWSSFWVSNQQHSLSLHSRPLSCWQLCVYVDCNPENQQLTLSVVWRKYYRRRMSSQGCHPGSQVPWWYWQCILWLRSLILGKEWTAIATARTCMQRKATHYPTWLKSDNHFYKLGQRLLAVRSSFYCLRTRIVIVQGHSRSWKSLQGWCARVLLQLARTN